jgi:predicted hydrocarbon binding protein
MKAYDIRREAEVLGSKHGLRLAQDVEELGSFAADSTHRVNLQLDLRDVGRRVAFDISARFGKRTAKTRDQAIEDFAKHYAAAAVGEVWRELERLGIEVK